MNTKRTEEEIRRRELIAEVAKKLWLEGLTVKNIEYATGATYHLFKTCIMEKEPDFFRLHERKRGRKYSYRDSLTPDELAVAARMYILKEAKFWQICAKFKIAPYLLRKLLSDAGVWRKQGDSGGGGSSGALGKTWKWKKNQIKDEKGKDKVLEPVPSEENSEGNEEDGNG